MSESLEKYESEQQKLEAERSGESQIEITAPKDPEVDPKIWKDVEPLLYRGFLTREADINGIYFVFKSLNHHEFELLRFSGYLRPKKTGETFWNSFLSYCVFMVDGVNVLSDRERWIPEMAKWFGSLPKGGRSMVVRYLSELNRRASAAVVLTEAYAMENVSRYRWMQLKGLDLTGPQVTGIDGTQRLGLNWAQQVWRAINQVEDRNEQHERDWENAKFIGSCFAGKGLQKVYNQDSERRRKDREERITRKDQIIREVVLGEKVDSKETVLPGMVVKVAKTEDELADQLQKDLRGEQDWHDKIVAEHEQRIQNQIASRQEYQAKMAQASEDFFAGKNVMGRSDTTGLTPKEVERRIRQSKQEEAQRAARMQVRPEMDEKTEGFLDKWGITGPEISSEVSTTDRDPSGAVPVPTRRPNQTKPFRRK